jgi:carboxyl-terminal processing protease
MVHFPHMATTPDTSWRALWMPVKVFLGLGAAGALFFGGYLYGKGPDFLGNVQAEGIFGTTVTVPADIAADVDFELFWQVWSLVRERYVDQPVSDQDLFEGALQGLMYGLNDPYSAYFTPKMAEEFSQELSGSFFGIGAELGLNDTGGLVVVAPISDTPAERAGVRAGDAILAIDGTDTLGMTVSQAVGIIRGEKGTDVTLTLLGAGETEARTVTITRDEIRIESVKTTIRPDGIGVVEVSMFGDDTIASFGEAADTLEAANVKGIIVDMRNNPGGYLEAAIALAGYWTGSNTVMQEEIRGERTEFAGDGDGRFADVPTVVLVNGGSASASEIFAGALQDYGYATVIGEQTFGKGSVQEYQELPDGGAVKITVARWLTPKGRSIDKEGIAPDQEVTRTLDDYHANLDPQLDAAIRFLTTK